MKEHDTVVLKRPIPKHGLVEGDVGAIVHVYPDDAGYEVEFVAVDGSTIALLTLGQDDIRLRSAREVFHVRQFADDARKPTYTTGVLRSAFSVGIIAILVGIAFAQMDNAADRSAVDLPTRAIISDLKDTIAAGDCVLADAKLTLLNERWQQFLQGGPSPEAFQSEVRGLKFVNATD